VALIGQSMHYGTDRVFFVFTNRARVAKEYEAEQQLPTCKEKLHHLFSYLNVSANAYLDQVGKDGVHDGVSCVYSPLI
jgi:hypothetical protein